MLTKPKTYTALSIIDDDSLSLVDDRREGNKTIASGLAAGYVRNVSISKEDQERIELNRLLCPIEQNLSVKAMQHIVKAIHKDSPIGPVDPVGVLYMLEYAGYLNEPSQKHVRHRWLTVPMTNGHNYGAWVGDLMFFLRWRLFIDPYAANGYIHTVKMRSSGYSASELPVTE